MEYVQMTMPELEERESSIKTKLGSIVENFLLVGKELDEIDRVSAYQLRGYKSIREYASDTFGISESFASRVLNVYRKYTEPGKELKLKEQYKGFNFSQLVELLNVPEEEHQIIRPELTKEDIRDFKRFEKENENNPGRLTAWKEENDTVRAAVEEFFRSRKKDLNEIYETYGIGPYSEEVVESMSRFLYHEKKKKFQTEQFFLMLYPNQVFIKSADGELRDVTWTDFFRTMGQIFDGKAAGKDTWKNYFATAQEEEQIPGQDSILKHPEYMPEESQEPIPEKSGVLHKKRFPQCIYETGTDCIGEDCDTCQKKAEWKKRRKEALGKTKEPEMKKTSLEMPEPEEIAPAQTKPCDRNPEYTCTLPEIQKAAEKEGGECWEKCCWNCEKHEACEYECDTSRNREILPEETHRTEIEALRSMLDKENRELEEWRKVDAESPLPERMMQEKQIMVMALAALLCDWESREEEPEQPELPRLKNNEERKIWLENYQDWGLWYRDEKIDVNYYKYDFKDGSRLVAAEYPMREGYWNQEPRDEHFFHLLKKNKEKYRARDEVYDEKFRNETDSITSLVEFLKEVQR